jgi:glycosyltransferase involved in cell wall biosynthesis
MTTFGITRTKNEQDIIAATVTRMCAQVDQIIVGDGSTDSTWEILEQLPVTLIRDETPTYEQSQQMTFLAHRAREMGADWIVPFDADEVWLAIEGRIADCLDELPDEVLVAEATVLNHIATALDDPDEPDPVTRIGWRRPEMLPLRKVACRALENLSIDFGNHGASYEGLAFTPRVAHLLNVRHFPYRSAAQFINKIAIGAPALLQSGLPEEFGAHWRAYGRTLEEHGPEALEAWFDRWAWSEDPENDPDVVFDPVPDLRPADLCP